MKNKSLIKILRSAIMLTLLALNLFFPHQGTLYTAHAAEIPPSPAEDESPTSDIFFDTDAVKKRVKSYSALSDLYGVSVFQDSFIMLEKQYQETQKQKYAEIQAAIFASEPWKADYEKWVNGVLVSEDVKVIKEAYQPTAAKSDLLTWITGIFFSVSLLCIAFVIDDIRKKKKKENRRNHRENNHYPYRSKA